VLDKKRPKCPPTLAGAFGQFDSGKSIIVVLKNTGYYSGPGPGRHLTRGGLGRCPVLQPVVNRSLDVQVQQPHAVFAPLALVGQDVGEEDDMRAVEDLHLGLVLGADEHAVLELLGHGVEVVAVLLGRSADVEDDHLLAFVQVGHVLHAAAEGDGAVLQHQVPCEPALALAAVGVAHPHYGPVVRRRFDVLDDAVLPGLGREVSVSRELSCGGSKCFQASVAPDEDLRVLAGDSSDPSASQCGHSILEV